MTEIKNRNFIREKYRPRSYSEELIHFLKLFPEETGLPVVIWIDEVRANKSSRHCFRVKVNCDYRETIDGDRDNLVEVDMKGNIYTVSDENEKRYSIKDEDFQALMLLKRLIQRLSVQMMSILLKRNTARLTTDSSA